jgi:hypothetical protein
VALCHHRGCVTIHAGIERDGAAFLSRRRLCCRVSHAVDAYVSPCIAHFFVSVNIVAARQGARRTNFWHMSGNAGLFFELQPRHRGLLSRRIEPRNGPMTCVIWSESNAISFCVEAGDFSEGAWAHTDRGNVCGYSDRAKFANQRLSTRRSGMLDASPVGACASASRCLPLSRRRRIQRMEVRELRAGNRF